MGWGSGNLGGGGAGKLFAAIGVTYPAGSTLTCSNGTKTLKAKNTSGQWVFAIPEEGEWTVKSFDGADYESSTNKGSETVAITAEGQSVTVELSYNFILFSAEKGLADGYALSQGTVSDGVINAGKSGDGRAVTFETPVDVTKFSSLTVEFGTIAGGSFFTFGLRDTYKEGYDGYAGEGYAVYIGGKGESSPKNFSGTTHTLELSNVTGEKYVKLSAYQTSTCQIKSLIFK